MKRINELMTHEDFESLIKGPYAENYLGRWEYYKEVIEIIKKQANKSIRRKHYAEKSLSNNRYSK